MMKLETTEITTPIGVLRAVVGRAGLCDLDFDVRWEEKRRRLGARFGTFELVERDDPRGIASALRAYMSGLLDALDAVEVDTGGSPFQRRVWQALRRIPVGETVSYGELARRIGQPNASRAVGMANNRNPIAIVVPCHRVIGADGTLTGYAGGLERKRWLLEHERAFETGQASLL
jgi:methylated-DNA-[protein]-cysteine S-methyltransferase